MKLIWWSGFRYVMSYFQLHEWCGISENWLIIFHQHETFWFHIVLAVCKEHRVILLHVQYNYTVYLRGNVAKQSKINLITLHRWSIQCLGNLSLESNDVILWRGIMTLYLCTKTVTISSRGPSNLSNFLFERQKLH